MVDADEHAQRARLAGLQRRLYRPDATAEDLQRYEALRDQIAAAAPRPRQPPEAAAVTTRRSGRPLLVAAAAVVAVAFAGAIALLQAPADPVPVARASGSASVVGTPRSALQLPSRSPQISERFNDDGETPVGTTVEIAVDGTRVLAQRFSGSGRAEVTLITGGAPLDGGLLTVTLRSSDPSSVSWRAQTGTTQRPFFGAGPPGDATQHPASREPTSVEYRGAPPAAIAVQAPAGTGWTLIVAFSR